MKSMTSLRGSVLHFQAIYDEPLNIFFKYSRTNRYFLNNDFVWIAYVYMHWIMLLFLFRVTCRESYFISELLSTMKDNLQQIKPLEFQVHTVNFSPPSSKTSDSEAIIHSLSKRSHDNGADHSDENHCTKRLCGEQDKSTPTGSESDPQKEVPYILDIDLDFFSTMNPFKDVYNERQYNILKDLYRYTPPTDSSDEVRKLHTNDEMQDKFIIKTIVKTTPLLFKNDFWLMCGYMISMNWPGHDVRCPQKGH